jgi:signal transduction histidine kinase
MTARGRAVIALGVVGFVAGAVPIVLAVRSSGGQHRDVIALFGPLIGWVFIGTGLLAWLRRPANRIGPLMFAVGLSFCMSSLLVSRQPWLYILGLLFQPLPYAIVSHILLAFPAGRLSTWPERLVVWAGYLNATVAHWTAVLFQDTSRLGAPRNPLLIAHGGDIVLTAFRARFVIGVVLPVALVLILVQHWRRAPASHRRSLAPVLLIGGLAMGLVGLWYAATLVGLPQGITRVVWEARVVALAIVPFAFLYGLLRSRAAQTGAVSRLVAELGEHEDRRRGLRDVLADALGDPTLTLAYWLPERGEYVDADGRPVELPPPGSGRVASPVERHGKPVAALIHDASLAEEHELVRAVGAAASLTLENERLDAQLRAKLEELRASRARIVETGDEARRRIERDLHDGAQQRLVSLALTLRIARSRMEQEPRRARELLESASRELDAALSELRELARGIHPAVLSERGLHAALQGLASRVPVPVELVGDLEDGLPKSVEAAAYFVVAEAITNVAKYAHATHATVSVQRQNGTVVVEVTDDGLGGADPDKGSGLRGLADRVAALDGRLDVISGSGHGTTVRATIPCE